MDSIVESTNGRPIVPHIGFSHAVSCFQPVINSTPVLSESSRSRNIFAAPVTRASLLRSTNDRDKPTHPNEQFDHRLFRGAPVVTAPTFLVFDYIDLYLTFFDMVRFLRVQTKCNKLQARDRFGEYPHPAVAS